MDYCFVSSVQVREFHNMMLGIKSGTAGQAESLALLYRIGERVPELAKLWKHYGPNAATGATKDNISSQAGFTVEIRIPADLATTSNHQVLSIYFKSMLLPYVVQLLIFFFTGKRQSLLCLIV
jgi:hypothetical protein